MKSTNGAAYILALAVTASTAGEAAAYTYNNAANPYAYYNWGQVYRQNQAARMHNVQQQQRLCNSLRATNRVKLPAACR